MANRVYPLLLEYEQKQLEEALHFMKMAELQEACCLLELPDSGKKGELIECIMLFIRTGKIALPSKIPAESRAEGHSHQPLHPKSRMLYGLYKNDVATRAFFKTLIGAHFHFTAFGIDWLNERWMAGNPPTYQEFADYWTAESKRRENTPQQPKKEWAYINFVQQMLIIQPDASRDAIMLAWKKAQTRHAQYAREIIKRIACQLIR